MVSQGKLDYSAVSPVAFRPKIAPNFHTPLVPTLVNSRKRSLYKTPKEYSSVFSPGYWLTPYLKYPLAPYIAPKIS